MRLKLGCVNSPALTTLCKLPGVPENAHLQLGVNDDGTSGPRIDPRNEGSPAVNRVFLEPQSVGHACRSSISLPVKSRLSALGTWVVVDPLATALAALSDV